MEQKETVCSVAKKCGGCRYQGVPYQDQLRKKQKITEGLLKKFGKVEPIIGMEDPYYYRNKSACGVWPRPERECDLRYL